MIQISSLEGLRRHQWIISPLIKLYHEAFPYEERRDLISLVHLIREGKARLFVLEEGGEVSAFSVVHSLPSLSYVEYICVDPNLRGRQLGSRFLLSLEKILTTPIILEVEPPECSPQAQRRIAFYTRLGYVLHSVPYVQIPYHEDSLEVPMRLMSKGNAPQENQIAQLLEGHLKSLSIRVYTSAAYPS